MPSKLPFWLPLPLPFAVAVAVAVGPPGGTPGLDISLKGDPYIGEKCLKRLKMPQNGVSEKNPRFFDFGAMNSKSVLQGLEKTS